MAIKFVNNVDFVFYNTKGLAIENLATAPSTTVEGAMYYNTSDNKLYYRNDSSWVPLTEDTTGVSTFTNTMGTFITGTNNAAATGAVSMGTIDLSATGTKNNTTFLRGDNTWAVPAYYSSWSIRGDDATAVETIVDGETVEFLGGTGIGTILNTSGSNAQLTISNAGVTGIIAGTNITVNQATGQVTINSADQYVGTVTSVGSGAGLTGGPITNSGTLDVDYIGSDNIIKAAGDGTSDTLGNSDQILVSSTDAKYVNLSQVKTYIAGVTEVTSATTNQLTVANSTTTPALSIVTAAVVNGGTGLATGDQIYDFVDTQLGGYVSRTLSAQTITGSVDKWTIDAGSNGAAVLNIGNGRTALHKMIIEGGMNKTTLEMNGALQEANTTFSYSIDPSGTDGGDLIFVGEDGTTLTLDHDKTATFSGNVVLNGTVTGTGVLDEDDLASNSATKVATQQSIKAYVDASNVGQSVFQGGYNAATNTPNLDTTSNVLANKGFFWAVTVSGTFFAENVQPGDLIYANVDIPANDSGNAASKWTVVQSGQDIATAASTDGASTKGIAGFDSAHFSTTANGWVQANLATNSATGVARVAAGTGIDVSVSSGVFTVSQETGSGRSKKVVLDSGDAGVAVATAGGVRTWTLTVDNAAIFNTGALSANIMAECYKVSNGTTAYPEVVRSVSNTNELEFKFLMSPLPSDGDYVVLLHNVAGI